MVNLKILGADRTFDKLPGKCPLCHYHISPVVVDGRFAIGGDIRLVFHCVQCSELFIAYYESKHVPSGVIYLLTHLKPNSFVARVFSEEIQKISPIFSEIYNQANHAESMGLNHICGPGFRKALEFLIKDYLIEKHPDKQQHIKESFLGRCIKESVTDPNIKACAERAVWLGNDETHYVREWETLDLKHMKELIDLTIHWISSEIITKRYLNEMSK